jgi:hypothetical protein
MGDDMQRRLSSAVLKQYTDRVTLLSSYSQAEILDTADDELVTAMSRSIQANVDAGAYTSNQVRGLLADVLAEQNNTTQRVHTIGIQIVDTLLTEYGHTPGQLRAIWDNTKTENETDSGVYPKNVAHLYALERHKRGASLRLFNDFGIAVFGRYPVEALNQQMDHIDDTQSPYGLLLVARFDIGFFQGAMYENTKMIQQLEEQLRAGGYLLRIAEAEGRVSVTKRHVDLNRRYGQYQKIAFGIHLAHGQPQRMRYGKKGEQAFVAMTDLHGPAAQAIQETYRLGAPQIFVSCSTGQPGGIAQQGSKLFAGPVIAPPVNISFPMIDVQFDEAHTPRFGLRYSQGAQPNEYLGGEHLNG